MFAPLKLRLLSALKIYITNFGNSINKCIKTRKYWTMPWVKCFTDWFVEITPCVETRSFKENVI